MRMLIVLILGLSFGFSACSSSTPADGDGDADGDSDGDSDGDVDGDGDSDLCLPPRAGVTGRWSVDVTFSDDTYVDIPCRFTGMTEDEEVQRIHLACGSGAVMEDHVIELRSSSRAWLLLAPGEEVILSFAAELIWWINFHFTLRTLDGTLLLAGVNADRLAPVMTTAAEFFAPLDPRVVDGICPVADADCGRAQRVGIEFTYDGQTTTVVDGNSGSAGMMVSYELVVHEARHYEEMTCEDLPANFYTALFILIPEG